MRNMCSFTSSIVSPVLWNEEVLSMQKSNTKIGNLEVYSISVK